MWVLYTAALSVEWNREQSLLRCQCIYYKPKSIVSEQQQLQSVGLFAYALCCVLFTVCVVVTGFSFKVSGF